MQTKISKTQGRIPCWVVGEGLLGRCAPAEMAPWHDLWRSRERLFQIDNNRHGGLGTQKINEQKRKPVRTGRGRLEDWGQARLGEQWEWIWNLFWGNGKPLAGLKEKVMISFASLNNYFWCRMDSISCRWHLGSLSPSPPSFFLSRVSSIYVW